jgi:hypothetical protein
MKKNRNRKGAGEGTGTEGTGREVKAWKLDIQPGVAKND